MSEREATAKELRRMADTIERVSDFGNRDYTAGVSYGIKMAALALRTRADELTEQEATDEPA